MNDNTKDIEQVLQDITFDDAIDCTHKDLLEQKLLLNFNAAQTRHANKWRFVMSTKMVRFAAAAVILIGGICRFAVIGRDVQHDLGSGP